MRYASWGGSREMDSGFTNSSCFNFSGPAAAVVRHRTALDLTLFSGLYLLAAVPAVWTTMPPSAAVLSCFLGTFLIILSAIDLRTLRLPDALTLPLLIAGLAIAAANDDLLWGALSALIGLVLLTGVALAYRAVRKIDGLGFGDAKLLAASGAWLGAEAVPAVLLYATSSALLCVFTSILIGKKAERTTRLPFGPFLALGTWLVWLYGPPL